MPNIMGKLLKGAV